MISVSLALNRWTGSGGSSGHAEKSVAKAGVPHAWLSTSGKPETFPYPRQHEQVRRVLHGRQQYIRHAAVGFQPFGRVVFGSVLIWFHIIFMLHRFDGETARIALAYFRPGNEQDRNGENWSGK